MALTTYVHVLDDEGVTHSFGPGDDVPGWARDKITNPDVWDESPDVGGTGEPPRAGRGSGRDAWVSFAQTHGVDVDDDDSRDDIIAVLVERGVISE